MIVRYWMKTPVITVTENQNLLEALDLMRSNRIRRLPVLQGEKLAGIVTLSDLYRFAGPHAVVTVLLSEEVGRVLRKQTVSEVMTPNPITCEPNTPLEEAGDMMRREKVGALPVLKNGAVFGMITESDVLSALVSISGSKAQGKRVCFAVPINSRKEVFSRVFKRCLWCNRIDSAHPRRTGENRSESFGWNPVRRDDVRRPTVDKMSRRRKNHLPQPI